MKNADIKIDIEYGIIQVQSRAFLDDNGTLQFRTDITKNGVTTTHQALRIIYK